jgi:dCTP deaminase
MIEPHQWIKAHAAQLGVEHCVIGPCSVDLTLGSTIRAYNYLFDKVQRAGVDTPVLFQRGWFYLVATQEGLCVPPTHCAFVHMRSTLARLGLGHKMAGLIDPGYEGQITLELETSLNVTVPVGARIVQVTFHRLDDGSWCKGK